MHKLLKTAKAEKSQDGASTLMWRVGIRAA